MVTVIHSLNEMEGGDLVTFKIVGILMFIFVAALGIYVATRLSRSESERGKVWAYRGNALAAGVLLSAAIVHIMPDSMAAFTDNGKDGFDDAVYSPLIGGCCFCFLLVLEEFLHAYKLKSRDDPHCTIECELYEAAPMVAQRKQLVHAERSTPARAPSVYNMTAGDENARSLSKPLIPVAQDQGDLENQDAPPPGSPPRCCDPTVSPSKRRNKSTSPNKNVTEQNNNIPPVTRTDFDVGECVEISVDNKNAKRKVNVAYESPSSTSRAGGIQKNQPSSSSSSRMVENSPPSSSSSALIVEQNSSSVQPNFAGNHNSADAISGDNLNKKYRGDPTIDTMHDTCIHHEHMPGHPVLEDTMQDVIRAYALFGALTFHSVLEGLGFGSAPGGVAVVAFIAVVAHKGLAAFALAQGLLQSNVPTARFYAFCFIFCMTSPVGAAIGMILQATVSDSKSMIPAVCNSMAAGTFLFIGAYELLHVSIAEAETPTEKVFRTSAVTAGFLAMSSLALLGA